MRPSPKSLANLRPPWTSETARLARLKATEVQSRKRLERKLYRDKRVGSVTNVRVSDIERRLLIAEQRIDQLTQVLKRAKILKPAKPKPTVGEDIPTLAKPGPAVADAMAGKQVDEPPTPANPG